MIKYIFITGDTHGGVTLLERAQRLETPPEETGIIVLGDAGLNFYLNKTDAKNKQKLQDSGFTFFCLRGNHEERPENLGMPIMHYIDPAYSGSFFHEEQYPNILYFDNFGWYRFFDYRIFVIGGAYSVDKFYRIANAPFGAKWTGWFEDEQLTDQEMLDCEELIHNTKYFDPSFTADFIFTHTCPIQWEPTDLFLSMIDQSSVDKSMELWLEEIEKILPYKIWLFGHYHADRMERPHVQQMYRSIEDIHTIYNRWYGDPPTINDEYWLPKSPLYYEGQ